MEKLLAGAAALDVSCNVSLTKVDISPKDDDKTESDRIIFLKLIALS